VEKKLTLASLQGKHKKGIFLVRYKLIVEGKPMQNVFCATGTS
jgi:hypothetical protein